MPGGQVEEGESIKDAAVRETKEECGLDIEVTKICGVFQNTGGSTCNTLFLGKPVGGELTATPEALEAGFFPIEDVYEMVTFLNFKQRIQLCLDEEAHPFYVEF
ncbi:NUDIX domain-containing protein [Rossellomorea vietnamensis]|uniref:NUDIX domain-containing protein n=1 Tax=Rossellomorea vietnamensis TaxID=218284 RepID=A0A5D4MGW2_9BACI|nr:NUDIX domain-containing protein [Rossellomorea vietnamensis]